MKPDKFSEILTPLDDEILRETEEFRGRKKKRRIDPRVLWTAVAALFLVGLIVLVPVIKRIRSAADEPTAAVTEENSNPAVTVTQESSARTDDERRASEAIQKAEQEALRLVRQAECRQILAVIKADPEHTEEVLYDEAGQAVKSLSVGFYTTGIQTIRRDSDRDGESALFSWEMGMNVLMGQTAIKAELLSEADIAMNDAAASPHSGVSFELIHEEGRVIFFEDSDVFRVLSKEGETYDVRLTLTTLPDTEPFLYCRDVLFDQLEYSDYLRVMAAANIRIEDVGQSSQEVVDQLNQALLKLYQSAADDPATRISPGSKYEALYREVYCYLPEESIITARGDMAVYAVYILTRGKNSDFGFTQLYDGSYDDVRLGGKIPDSPYGTVYLVQKTAIMKEAGYYSLHPAVDGGEDSIWLKLEQNKDVAAYIEGRLYKYDVEGELIYLLDCDGGPYILKDPEEAAAAVLDYLGSGAYVHIGFDGTMLEIYSGEIRPLTAYADESLEPEIDKGFVRRMAEFGYVELVFSEQLEDPFLVMSMPSFWDIPGAEISYNNGEAGGSEDTEEYSSVSVLYELQTAEGSLKLPLVSYSIRKELDPEDIYDPFTLHAPIIQYEGQNTWYLYMDQERYLAYYLMDQHPMLISESGNIILTDDELLILSELQSGMNREEIINAKESYLAALKKGSKEADHIFAKTMSEAEQRAHQARTDLHAIGVCGAVETVLYDG